MSHRSLIVLSLAVATPFGFVLKAQTDDARAQIHAAAIAAVHGQSGLQKVVVVSREAADLGLANRVAAFLNARADQRPCGRHGPCSWKVGKDTTAVGVEIVSANATVAIVRVVSWGTFATKSRSGPEGWSTVDEVRLKRSGSTWIVTKRAVMFES